MTVGETLVHVKNTLLLFWPLVSLFLSCWPLIGHSQYRNPPEVVIPLRVTGRGRHISTRDWLSYSLHFGGQRHIVHMKTKKVLVSRDFSVFTYTDQGALVEDMPFVQNDCFYHGYVEGDPESLVALSTCFGGFQGMLQINDIAYEIKPKTFSATFEHLVYKIDSQETQSLPRCGLTEEEIAWQLKFQKNATTTLMQSSLEGIWLHQWFLELAIVIEHEQFIFRGSNISKVELEVLMAIDLVDVFYNIMGLDVILTGLEIWNEENPYIASSTRTMLRAFCNWKKVSFNSRVSHDAAHIVIKQDFCNTKPFTSHYKGICDINRNCGLECILSDQLLPFASAVAHELGHNLWMRDDDSTCVCGKSICIMNKEVSPAEVFSNCSYAAFFNIISNSTCLHTAPNPEHIITFKRCGNGVVEEEEQCDCGSMKSCTNDTCCLQNCTLTPGADCASGLCCKDCKFRPSGTLCRAQENECDLPEWCNGISPKCPDDVYVEDGIPCLNDSFCYEKRCNSHDEQCKKIFGKEAKNANQICYKEINIRGDRFGHCSVEDTRYVPCDISDILCGRVQCENVIAIPSLEEHTTVHWTQINGVTCWGTDYHFGMSMTDIGNVKDGTVCGTEYMCLHKKCVPMPLWEDACLPDSCSMRGVCNNKHHCHCDYDWAPPNCLKEGNGGSIDSGPPPQRRRKPPWWIYLLILISLSSLPPSLPLPLLQAPPLPEELLEQ
ncbi:disintegrin and metalloproteinase domain-containing protein 21-like [Sciurus carolinensis]|uniref:disintegrin and metalloproteinase domain-containing protein 21-like n=1 Tax=Sciurus carolinensis TaxID=30640 RepID=UPI001FB1CFEC|nr:disintegrin and metalloproteinase domain-containing protein 21-like [Sciurus carolinensis]